MSTTELATVLAWHSALNDGDVDRLVALSSDDIEVGGPRGSGRGADLLRDWATRAGISLEPARVFQRATTVVVEQRARWLTADDGRPTEPTMVASVFLVAAGRVASVIRHPDLAAALAAAGLDESDERQPDPGA